MNVLDSIKARARSFQRLIALPETEDERTYAAARQVVDQGLARVVLIGARDVVENKAREFGVSLDGMCIIDPHDPEVHEACTRLYADLRRNKGVTYDQAREQVLDPLYCAACLLKLGEIDGCVAGASHTTADTVRPLLQIVKTQEGVKTASSCFVMTTQATHLGVKGAFIYADAGLLPQPTAAQLADIAISSTESCELYLEAEPYVAMLSFSTHGSADHPDVEKVREATRIAQELRPDLHIDGELQGDAAVCPEVARRKCPDSEVAGRANVLIFPDLDAGNIAYKLTQYIGGAGAYGPLLQGLAKAGMDLSRGATPEDIANVVAVAAVRAEALAR
ncbi:MAG: phosphate acetyltransferase [Armatimonadota bacterium]